MPIKKLVKKPTKIPIKKPVKKSTKMPNEKLVSFDGRARPLRVLVAPDSFKESLPADKVAAAIRKGILLASPTAEVIALPLADGGEGTLDSIMRAVNPSKVEGAKSVTNELFTPRWVVRTVKGPLKANVKAKYLEISSQTIADQVLRKKLGIKTIKTAPSEKPVVEDVRAKRQVQSSPAKSSPIAIIEIAQAAGFQLLMPSERNPLLTSTFGVGQLIKDAIDRGIRIIVLTIGGSATNDGGTGMATALGYRFLDGRGRPVLPRGGELDKIRDIDDSNVDPRIKATKFFVAADVTNPFYGPKGAAFVYGPQKGASQAQVKKLDNGLLCLARVIKRKYEIDLQKVPGSGAAGGLGGAATTFLGAKMLSGIEFVAQICDLKSKAKDIDLCIVAEGRFDRQSLSGKAAVGIAGMVAPIPVVLLAGSIGISAHEFAKKRTPISAALAIQNGPMSFQDSKSIASELLTDTAFHIVKVFLARSK